MSSILVDILAVFLFFVFYPSRACEGLGLLITQQPALQSGAMGGS